MEAWTNVGVPLIVALLTSTALWGVVSKVILKRMELAAKRSKADEAERKMLVGLAQTASSTSAWCTSSGATSRRTSMRTCRCTSTSRMKRWAATAAHGASWRKCGSCPYGEA